MPSTCNQIWKDPTTISGDNEDLVNMMVSSDASPYGDVTALRDRSDSDTMSSNQEVYTPSTTSNSQVVYTPSVVSEDVVRKEYAADDYPITESDPLLQASPPPCYQNNASEPLARIHQAGEAGELRQGTFPGHGICPARECNDLPSAKGGYTSEAVERGKCRRWFGWRRGRERRRVRRRCACTGTKIILFLFKFALLFGLLVWLLKDKFHGKHNKHKSPPGDIPGHHPPKSREIVIENTHNAIWGRFPLYDLLSLTTTSGSIAVVIDPQPADPADPLKPARVVLKSESGSIFVSFSSRMMALERGRYFHDDDGDCNNDSDSKGKCGASSRLSRRKHKSKKEKGKKIVSSAHLSARPYQLDVKSASGSITGSYIFSTSANMLTQSGSIRVRLMPIVFANTSSLHSTQKGISIITSTHSGSTHLEITEPCFLSNKTADKWTSVNPLHHSFDTVATASHIAHGSGSMLVTYPPSWAGRVHAESAGNGKIRLSGDGLQVHKNRPNSADGVKDPNPTGSKKKEWWGSTGEMTVSLLGEGSGAVKFCIRGI